MQCPTCAGQQLQAAGADRFECVSQIQVGEKLVGVVPRGPYQAFEIPVYHPVYRACGCVFSAQQAADAAERRVRARRAEEDAARARADTERARRAEESARLALERARDLEVNEVLPKLPRPAMPAPFEAGLMTFLPRVAAWTLVSGWVLTIAITPHHFNSKFRDPYVDRVCAVATGTSFVCGMIAAAIAWRRGRVRHARAQRLYTRDMRAAGDRDQRRERLRESLRANDA
jgi:hypothetical protein